MIKFYTIFLFLTLTVNNLFGQLGFNTSSLSLSIGNHFAVENQGSSTRIFRPSHLNFNYRYMFNNKFGLMSTFGYDRFSFKNDVIPSNYYRLTIETSINLREILGFSEFVENFGTLAHAGIGLSGLWSKNIAINEQFKKTNFDQLVHFTFGLTPKYRINNTYSVHVDLSYITQLNQDFSYDTRTIIKPKEGISGGFVNFSVGATMSLGPRKHHADWYTFPTLVDKDLEKINLLEIQLEQLEMKLEDYDGDGVSNYLDDEPNTPKGNQVDTRGVTVGKLEAPKKVNDIDSLFSNPEINPNKKNIDDQEKKVVIDSQNSDRDGDGVPDIYDLFPDVVGTYKGCPDADGDQIPDVIDNCPNIKGFAKFNGCPEKTTEPIKTSENTTIPEIKPEQIKPIESPIKAEITPENTAFSEVFFEVGISMLSIKSTTELDKLAKYLKENPKVNVDVIGFADQSGSPAANEKLSKQRANECVNYLVTKGVNRNRFVISNITVINKDGINPLIFGSKNRKVSFILKQ